MASPRARIVKIRDGLTPSEWLRVGGMLFTVVVSTSWAGAC